MNYPKIIIAVPQNNGNGFYTGSRYTFKRDNRLGLTYETKNSHGHSRVESGDTLLNGKGSAHLNRGFFTIYGWKIIEKID